MKDQTKKEIVLIIGACLIGGLATFFLVNFDKLHSYLSGIKVIGEIKQVQNTVKFRNPEVPLWIQAQNGGQVVDGMTVMTDDDSNSIINVDGVEVEIKENSLVTITKQDYKIDAINSLFLAKKESKINLTVGGKSFTVEAKEKSSFSIYGSGEDSVIELKNGEATVSTGDQKQVMKKNSMVLLSDKLQKQNNNVLAASIDASSTCKNAESIEIKIPKTKLDSLLVEVSSDPFLKTKRNIQLSPSENVSIKLTDPEKTKTNLFVRLKGQNADQSFISRILKVRKFNLQNRVALPAKCYVGTPIQIQKLNESERIIEINVKDPEKKSQKIYLSKQDFEFTPSLFGDYQISFATQDQECGKQFVQSNIYCAGAVPEFRFSFPKEDTVTLFNTGKNNVRLGVEAIHPLTKEYTARIVMEDEKGQRASINVNSTSFHDIQLKKIGTTQISIVTTNVNTGEEKSFDTRKVVVVPVPENPIKFEFKYENEQWLMSSSWQDIRKNNIANAKYELIIGNKKYVLDRPYHEMLVESLNDLNVQLRLKNDSWTKRLGQSVVKIPEVPFTPVPLKSLIEYSVKKVGDKALTISYVPVLKWTTHPFFKSYMIKIYKRKGDAIKELLSKRLNGNSLLWTFQEPGEYYYHILGIDKKNRLGRQSPAGFVIVK